VFVPILASLPRSVIKDPVVDLGAGAPRFVKPINKVG
jgi:hypothetical protein